MSRRSLLGPVLALAACGGDDGPSAPADAGAKPAPGPSAEGWTSAYLEGSARAGCGAPESAFAGLPHVTVAGATIYVGYDQVSADNQDPVVARFDDGAPVWCRRHEDDPPDARAVGITWDGGDVAYVVYTVVGGGTDLEGRGGWIASYAPGGLSGGGAKVSVVGRVDVATGELAAATFVIAALSSNKVNSHGPAGAATRLADGTVELLGASAHKPIDADGRTPMPCTDYPFDTRYRFSADLATLICAESTNCTPTTPCP